MTTVAVFTGWRSAELAGYGFMVGRALGDAGFDVVYGGGSRGAMAGVAGGAQAAGAKVTAVTLPRWEADADPAALEHVADQVVTVSTMSERVAGLANRADGFLVLPGGRGTLRELLDVWDSRANLEHDKPIVILDPSGHYSPLLAMFRDMANDGHTRADEVNHVYVSSEVRTAVAVLRRQIRRPVQP